MAKEIFELTDFGGIDNSVTSEDSSVNSGSYSENIDNLSKGELSSAKSAEITDLAQWETSQDGAIGTYPGNILSITTLNDDDKTDIITINGGDVDNNSVVQTPLSVEVVKDVYRFFDNPSAYSSTDSDGKINLMGPLSLKNSNEADSVLRNDSSIYSGIASVEKWNNSLHIGLGDRPDTDSIWIGKVKGGFLTKEDSKYNQLSCTRASLDSVKHTNYTKVVTDCLSGNYNHLTSADREKTIGKYAFAYNYGGNYVYKYDLDPEGDGTIGDATLVGKSPRFGNLVALTYDMNGKLAEDSFGSSEVMEQDGLVIVVDSEDSGIGDFGGLISLMRAHDLKVIATYPIRYPIDRPHDDGMDTYHLGLDRNSNTSQWYHNTRGSGIGDIMITNPIEDINTSNDDASSRTLWVSIAGNHRIGICNGDFNNEFTYRNFTNTKYGRASFRVLWRTRNDFFTNGWPDSGTDIELVNASPPCQGFFYDSITGQDMLSAHLRTSGWWQIPKNALTYSSNEDWVGLIATGIKNEGEWQVADSNMLVSDSDYSLKHWPWGAPCPDETAELYPKTDSIIGAYNPLEISSKAYNTPSDGSEVGVSSEHYQLARICSFQIHHKRDLRLGDTGKDIFSGDGTEYTWKSLQRVGNVPGFMEWDYDTQNNVNCFRTASTTETTADSGAPDMSSAGKKLRATCGIELLLKQGATVQDAGSTADFNNIDILAPGEGAGAAAGNNDHLGAPSNPFVSNIIFHDMIKKIHRPTSSGINSIHHRYVIIRGNDGYAYVNAFAHVDPLYTRIEEDASHNVLWASLSQYTPDNSEKTNWRNFNFVPLRLYNGSEQRYYPNENYDGSDTYDYDSIGILGDSDDEWASLLSCLVYSPTVGRFTSGFIGEHYGTGANDASDIYDNNNPNLEGLESFNLTHTESTEDIFSMFYSYKAIVDEEDIGTITITEGNPTEVGGFAQGSYIYNYFMTYLLDGYQETPLGEGVTYIPSSIGATNASINISLRCADDSFLLKNLRITGVNIYRQKLELSGAIIEEAQLVKSLSFNSALWYKVTDTQDYDDAYIRQVIITDSNQPGVSYSALNDIPDTLDSTSLNYSMSTQIGSYHFVAKCYIPDSADHVPNGIFRSKPAKFDIFDWSNDYILLPETPTAIQGFRGRLYAFSDSNTYIIDPNTLQVLDKYEGSGCFGPNSVAISDEYGMLFVNKRGIYINNGSSTQSIGAPILSKYSQDNPMSGGYLSLFASFIEQFDFSSSGDGVSMSDRFAMPKVYYNGERECFLISCHVPYGDNTADKSGDNSSVFMYTPKYNRWDIYRQPIVAAVNGNRGDMFFINGMNKATFLQNTADHNTQIINTQENYSIGRLFNLDRPRRIVWQSHKITMGSPTQDKILSKIIITGSNLDSLVPFGASNFLTDKHIDTNYSTWTFTPIDAESNATRKVYKFGWSFIDLPGYPTQSYMKKVKWIKILLLSSDSIIESVGVTYKRRTIK